MQARDPILGIPAPESVKGLGRPPRGGGGCSPLSSGSPQGGTRLWQDIKKIYENKAFNIYYNYSH